MVRGSGTAEVSTRPGRRAGWGNLAPWAYIAYQTVPQGPAAKELTIGKVQANDRDGQTVLVQPHRARWHYVKITHEPLYQSQEGLTTRSVGSEAVDSVRYEALMKVVSLLSDSELTPGDARDRDLRGGGARERRMNDE